MLFCIYWAVRLNNADLKKQYLGPKPLLRKRCYYERIKAVWHNNVDLKKRYLGSKPLLRKRCYYELIRAVWHNSADLKKRYIHNLAEMTAEGSVWCRR